MLTRVTCLTCTSIFEYLRTPGAPGRLRRYCSPRCKTEAGRAKARAAYVPRPPLTPEQRSSQAREAVRVRWAKATDPEARSEAARGSAAVRWAGHTRQTNLRHREPRPCRYCGDVVPMASNQVRCGKDDCRLSYNAERNNIYWHQYRAQKLGLSSENIRPRDIFERDGWLCGICNQPVDPTLKAPHPNSPSLDHIQLISHGGSHTEDNVRCAHLGCNVRRGRRVEKAG